MKPGQGFALLGALLLLGVLVAAPLAMIAAQGFSPAGLAAWRQLLSGELASPLLWRPLANTISVGLAVAALSTLCGGFLAFLCTMTDLPYRRTIAILGSVPFILPGFATALAWAAIFANDRAGAALGVFAAAGFVVPDWLAWGAVPTVAVLAAQYYALAFTVIAAALSGIGADIVDAARLAGARGWRVVIRIVFPLVRPALVSGAMLAFAGAISNFATPALLGLPVRFQTLSTRLFGLMEIGQMERAIVLAIVLLIASGIVVWAAQKIRASGVGAWPPGRAQSAAKLPLGAWRWPAFVCAALLVVSTSVAPIVILFASSFAETAGGAFSSFTWRHWMDTTPGNFGGVLLNDEVWRAGAVTIQLGIGVALLAVVLALFLVRVLQKNEGTRSAMVLNQVSFTPLLIPDIVFATAYLLVFAGDWSPVPLYGTFALLVMAMTAHLLPYAIESVRSVVASVNPQLEEAARLTRANRAQRIALITVPLLLPGLLAGVMMVFAKTVRDIALVIVLFTPTTAVLSIVAFRYVSEGQAQAANAVTLLILLMALSFIGFSKWLESRSMFGLQRSAP